MIPVTRVRFDRLARYRLSAVLFGIVWLVLLTRIFHWPDLPREVILGIYLTLTTPAMALLVYNVGESSWQMYQAKRRIDRLLEDQDTP